MQGTLTEPETDDGSERILQATDIEHAYGQVSVLEGVSLGLSAGEITGLIGPNGAGKSTLIRALAGLQEPTAGEVTYRGPESVRPIGYLPQRPAFRPGQSVADALAFYASLVGADRSEALARLEAVGLADAADRDVEALSGGMTRLVGIAQATIGDPPVIVLDEPASGLDPEMSLHIFEVLSDLAAAGRAVLLSSHDLALVEESCDRVALLDGGEIRARGAPKSLRDEAGVESLLAVFKSTIGAEAGTVRVQGVTS